MRLRITTLALLLCAASISAEKVSLWIGTSTPRDGQSKGIYRAVLDLQSGVLTTPDLAAEIADPGFVALHPNGQRLYSLCELPSRQGSGVAAFEISADKTSLKLLNTQPIGDGGAAHLTVDRSGRVLFTAQYGGGSVAAFPIAADGTISPRTALVEHEGAGPNQARQREPHPHWVGTDPANRFLFVPDLGIDQVVIYRMDLEHARIERHGSVRTPAGAGPRHMKFHPTGKYAFVLNELQLSITLFRYDPEAGALSVLQTISTLPDSLREMPNSASEIRIHPGGQFVYAANRGHDSIAAFRFDPATEKLAFLEHESIRGSWPRNFNLDPTGRWLLAAGRNSNTISVFRIDPQSGGLIYTGKSVHCPTPICIEF